MLADEERNTLVEKEKSFQDAAFIGMGAERMKRKYEEKSRSSDAKEKTVAKSLSSVTSY